MSNEHTRLKNIERSPLHRKADASHRASGQAEASSLHAAALQQAQAAPMHVTAMLGTTDAATQARVVEQLQQERGNAYVQRLVGHLLSEPTGANRQYQVQRQNAGKERTGRITRGPGGVPAVQLGSRFRQVWHPGVRIGTNIILNIFEQGNNIMIAWYDLSRSRHEIRPMHSFQDRLEAGPVGEMRPADWRAYRLLDRVPPREWYEHRDDPVGFIMAKLETLKPGGAEEKAQVEKTLAPAAYRAAIKRLALANLVESEKQTRAFLGKGRAFFARLAKPWGPLEQKKAALEAEQTRLRRAIPQRAAGVPELPGHLPGAEPPPQGGGEVRCLRRRGDHSPG